MRRFRTVLAFLVTLTLAFAPVASVAMPKACSMTTAMSDDGAAECACHKAMPDCGSMPQCQTSAGCASQCYAGSGLLPSPMGPTTPVLDDVKMAESLHLSSLSIRPPAPPPRA
jgi:hypothetical protein